MFVDLVKIKDLDLVNILEFRYTKVANEHCEAVIKGLIAEKDYEEYFQKSLVDEWATITGIDEHGNQECIFCGYIKNMSLIKEQGHKAVELVLVSGTYLMDVTRRIKTYQDADELYSDIVDGYSFRYIGSNFMISNKAKKKLGSMIVQYEETDWEFIKRMASNINLLVIPHATHEGARLDFGVDESDNYLQFNSILQSSEVHDGEIEINTVKTRDYLDVGVKVKYNDEFLYVYSAKGEYINQELVNVYEMRKCRDFVQKKKYNDRIIGASLEAEVLDVQGDQVQVRVLGENGTKRKWFQYATIYSSPDGTGWYCMPEIRDRVRLYFPSNVADEAYVISSVHLPAGMDGARSNPNNKSIKNKDGNEILFTPEGILITNNKGMSIEIDDVKGISIVSNKKISITSEEEVELTAKSGSVKVKADESIDLVQNTSSIKIKDDIIVTGGRLKTV